MKKLLIATIPGMINNDDIKVLEEKLTELDVAQKEALLFIPNMQELK